MRDFCGPEVISHFSQVTNTTTMSAKETKIFRPWDDADEISSRPKIYLETSLEQEFRVPPTDWNEALEQYWSYVANSGAFSGPPSKAKQRPKRFKCSYCDVAFSNNGQLKGHVRIHTGERPFKCEEEGCGKTFTRNEELTRHKRIHSGVRPFPCPHCGKTFGRKDHLKKHTRTHLPQYAEIPSPFYVYPFVYGY